MVVQTVRSHITDISTLGFIFLAIIMLLYIIIIYILYILVTGTSLVEYFALLHYDDRLCTMKLVSTTLLICIILIAP
jgi:hypothetical protein